jgi:hypothetical protein
MAKWLIGLCMKITTVIFMFKLTQFFGLNEFIVFMAGYLTYSLAKAIWDFIKVFAGLMWKVIKKEVRNA